MNTLMHSAPSPEPNDEGEILNAVRVAVKHETKPHQENLARERRTRAALIAINVSMIIVMTMMNAWVLRWPLLIALIVVGILHLAFAPSSHAAAYRIKLGQFGKAVFPAFIALTCFGGFVGLGLLRYRMNHSWPMALVGLVLDAAFPLLFAYFLADAHVACDRTQLIYDEANNVLESVRTAKPGKQADKLASCLKHLRELVKSEEAEEHPDNANIKGLRGLINRLVRESSVTDLADE